MRRVAAVLIALAAALLLTLAALGGLTAFAVSIGSGKLVPAVASGVTWPYTAIGIGFAALGVLCSGYAFSRHRKVEEAVSRGEFAPPDERLIGLLSGAAAALGVLLVVVLLTEV